LGGSGGSTAQAPNGGAGAPPNGTASTPSFGTSTEPPAEQSHSIGVGDNISVTDTGSDARAEPIPEFFLQTAQLVKSEVAQSTALDGAKTLFERLYAEPFKGPLHDIEAVGGPIISELPSAANAEQIRAHLVRFVDQFPTAETEHVAIGMMLRAFGIGGTEKPVEETTLVDTSTDDQNSQDDVGGNKKTPPLTPPKPFREIREVIDFVLGNPIANTTPDQLSASPVDDPFGILAREPRDIGDVFFHLSYLVGEKDRKIAKEGNNIFFDLYRSRGQLSGEKMKKRTIKAGSTLPATQHAGIIRALLSNFNEQHPAVWKDSWALEFMLKAFDIEPAEKNAVVDGNAAADISSTKDSLYSYRPPSPQPTELQAAFEKRERRAKALDMETDPRDIFNTFVNGQKSDIPQMIEVN
jgi:hypothetical protein